MGWLLMQEERILPVVPGALMSDTAVRLVERVLPAVPIRHWVCSVPWRLRIVCGYDRKLCSDVMGAFIHALTHSLRFRAKRAFGLRKTNSKSSATGEFATR